LSQPEAEQPARLGFGTFLGVVTPTTLTILGVIMYLRLGWVVGNAGLVGTLSIVLIAHVITFITALSLSALATSMRVGAGGAYWLISRSMGLELGGALGIPLYLSQVLSVTLYAFGLAESVRIFYPLDDTSVQWLAAGIVVAVVMLAIKSTELALKAQLPIMAMIAVSLIALVSGVDFQGSQVPAFGPLTDASYWEVFAVFFPAVTGLLAGLGLSGDLRDPGRSIPRGVLLSVAVGFVVYMGLPWVLASAADAESLRTDPLIWTRLAPVYLIVLGLFGAILSSAIGSILSAPRTVQALAQDGLAPAGLGRADKKTGEPVRALRLSGVLALSAVLLGDLNMVASVVTMFFLTTYGMLNLAAGLEALIKDPSFRPRIRVPWWISMLGAVGCFVAMFSIHPGACLVAIAVEVLLWYGLSRRAMRTAWGDMRSGMWFTLARFAMLRLGQSKHDPRNWRPHILVFTIDLERNMGMVRLATNFSQDRGIVTVSTLMLGDVEGHAHAEEIAQRNRELLKANRIVAFSETAAVPELEAGIVTVAQANGFAGLTSNMVMFGWPGEEVDRVGRLMGIVRRMAGIEKSTMIVRPVKGSRARGSGEAHIWWKGREHNGDMMLLLCHLLSQAAGWRHLRLVLKSVAEDEIEAQEIRGRFESMFRDLRMDVALDVSVRPPESSGIEVLQALSKQADLVFIGLRVPAAGDEHVYARTVLKMVEGMPTVIFVRNASRFHGRLI
jgi:solute carrier family 12 (potassium/chloride transporter), member 4/6